MKKEARIYFARYIEIITMSDFVLSDVITWVSNYWNPT